MFQIDLYFLRKTFAATSVAVFFSGSALADTAAACFERLQVQPEAGIEVTLPVAVGDGLHNTRDGERITVRYPMQFNQIAEGWSWRPGADPAVDDYYHDKFLPLQSVTETRGDYVAEDKIGSPQRMRVQWRYDYFFAFDNLYDFYPRSDDDEAGFSATLPASVGEAPELRATLQVTQPVTQESTTFWKATHGQPQDFTLKKRYLTGRLISLAFHDPVTGQLLCRIPVGRAHCDAP